jgi:hypothetical protein
MGKTILVVRESGAVKIPQLGRSVAEQETECSEIEQVEVKM